MKKVIIFLGVIVLLSAIFLTAVFLGQKEYLIPYSYTEIYGVDLEELFPLGKSETMGEVLYQNSIRDENKNIILSLTASQRKTLLRNMEEIMDTWKGVFEQYDFVCDFGDDYSDIYISGEKRQLEEVLTEENIHFIMVLASSYHIVSDNEGQVVTFVLEDDRGNTILQKQIKKFDSRVNCYKLESEDSVAIDQITEWGYYELINTDYNGNIQVIATKEQYDKLMEMLK